MAMSNERIPHEYLMEEDYYENNSVGNRSRSDYGCEHCGKTIKKGEPHDHHKFYPEFQGYRTHKTCSKAFIASLRTAADDPDPLAVEIKEKLDELEAFHEVS